MLNKPLTPRMKKLLKVAMEISNKKKVPYVGIEHFLEALSRMVMSNKDIECPK